MATLVPGARSSATRFSSTWCFDPKDASAIQGYDTCEFIFTTSLIQCLIVHFRHHCHHLASVWMFPTFSHKHITVKSPTWFHYVSLCFITRTVGNRDPTFHPIGSHNGVFALASPRKINCLNIKHPPHNSGLVLDRFILGSLIGSKTPLLCQLEGVGDGSPTKKRKYNAMHTNSLNTCGSIKSFSFDRKTWKT